MRRAEGIPMGWAGRHYGSRHGRGPRSRTDRRSRSTTLQPSASPMRGRLAFDAACRSDGWPAGRNLQGPLRRSAIPAVLEAYVVESTVESERRVLAVAVGQCVCTDRILLRIVVEGVLATDRYRDGPGPVIGSLKVDQVVATGVLEHVEPGSPPRVVVEARQEAPLAGSRLGGDVPTRSWQGIFEALDPGRRH